MVNNYQYKKYLSLGEYLLCGMGVVLLPNYSIQFLSDALNLQYPLDLPLFLED